MQRHAILLAAVLAFSGLTSASAAEATARKTWIVGTTGSPVRAAVAERHRARPVRMFRSIDAYAVEMTAAEADALRSKPGVRWVEPEYEAFLLRSRSTATTPRRTAEPATADAISTAQSVPWGIDLVRAEELWA
ncbi:MAG: protease inhibitor I9 family protein, partial [Thermoanaerobaculia bacterium]